MRLRVKLYKINLEDDDRIMEMLAGMAVRYVRDEYNLWRDTASVETAATFMASKFLAGLPADTRKDAEIAIKRAFQIMGAERAEILLLRHDMGFGAGCRESRDDDPEMSRHTYGGIVWTHPSTMFIPCPDCIGLNGFTDDEIAQTVSKGRAAPIGSGEVAILLEEARTVWVEQLNGEL
ncbi:hypothetical protein Q0Z83_047320 [Actinoplanes sichuanensis]|uniref:Uncharacterized protein n=1 Tax=Actinoplanes sichuanensis TaxID=512349 RepID=A0ABW4A8I2_9ACTN|nr:hypothetical protein [Actinoplanes sichuanensis]BEL06541.1 hypothetical protein Q0Z83_047320 [Actinoplanes sichuanensis]